MEPDTKALIHSYLSECTLMQLATSRNDQPWICNVWFTADKQMQIYWFSADHRRHSQEILNNDKVAATIVRPYTTLEIPSGLQLQGKSTMVTDKREITKVFELFKKKQFSIQSVIDTMKESGKSFHFYKIKPTLFAVFDTIYFPHKTPLIVNVHEKN